MAVIGITMTIPRVSNTSHRDSPDSGPSQPYAIVARSVALDPNLSDAAFRLYVLLDSRATGRAIHVKTATLAADLNRSEKSISRAMTELVQAGYVVRKRTRSVSVTAVENPIRHRSKPSTAQTDLSVSDSSISSDLSGADRTDLSGTSRSNPFRNKTNITRRTGAARDPLPIGAKTAANPLHLAYVEAIAESTQLPLRPTGAVVRKIEKIASRGMTPAQAGEAARGQMLLASGMRNLRNPVGFLAETVLDALGDPHSAPTEPNAFQRAETIRALLNSESAPSKSLETASAAPRDPFPGIDTRKASIDPEASQRGIAACREALQGRTERSGK